jgi:hypothetical protein
MTLKKTLLAGAAGAALFAFAAPVATPAEAGSIKGGSATDLTVYGQVSRGILFYDDGAESGYRHVDADNSSTRFGFKASGKVNESVTMGAVFEAEIQSNDSNTVSQNVETDSATFAERLMNVYISHKQFGKITMGQASATSDGMSDGLDLSGAAFAFSGMDVQLGNGGALLFRNDNTAGALSTATIGGTFTTFDRGRQDLIQYHTPSFSGLVLEASLYERGDWGIGANYDQKHGSVQVRVRAFYENLSGAGTTGSVYQAGASLKHDSGISVTGLYGNSDQDSGNNHKMYSARLGYTANMNSLGATGIAVNYLGTEDIQGDGGEGTAWGIGVVQDIKSAGANLYGAVNFWDRDKTTAETVDTKEIVTVVVGARVAF